MMVHLGLFWLLVPRVAVLEDTLGQEVLFGAAHAVRIIRQKGRLFPVVPGEGGGQRLVGFAWCIWRLRTSQTRHVCRCRRGVVSDVSRSIVRLCQPHSVEEELKVVAKSASLGAIQTSRGSAWFPFWTVGNVPHPCTVGLAIFPICAFF